jgi:hypothetical protein
VHIACKRDLATVDKLLCKGVPFDQIRKLFVPDVLCVSMRRQYLMMMLFIVLFQNQRVLSTMCLWGGYVLHDITLSVSTVTCYLWNSARTAYSILYVQLAMGGVMRANVPTVACVHERICSSCVYFKLLS